MGKKKMLLIILIIILIIALGTIYYLKSLNKNAMTGQKGENIFIKLESALKINGLTWDKEPENPIIYGAEVGYKYSLSNGTIFEIYLFEKGNRFFKDIRESGVMPILNSNIKYKVDVVEKQNVAIYYRYPGTNIDDVKKIIK